MSVISETLRAWTDGNGISISGTQLERFEIYAELLVEWNRKINLTAITEPKEIAVKHFIDSLTVLKSCDIGKHSKMIDVGTGAGFPSIPLKILRDDIQLTLLDSLNKRLIFLNDLCSKIGIDAETVHARAEDAGRDPSHREKYDIAVSRAVANMPSLCEYCLPLVRVGGMFAAMKGKDGSSELKMAERSVELLGGKCDGGKYFVLPGGGERMVFVIEKLKHTPSEYPRKGVKISKEPIV